MAETLEERFRRLLTMVPYMVRHPGVSVSDVRKRFGITRSQLVADLNLLFVCGLPGYGPGDLIEAFVDGSRVWIRLADYFSRPLRLTAAEGLLLYSGARALSAARAGGRAPGRGGQAPGAGARPRRPVPGERGARGGWGAGDSQGGSPDQASPPPRLL